MSFSDSSSHKQDEPDFSLFSDFDGHSYSCAMPSSTSQTSQSASNPESTSSSVHENQFITVDGKRYVNINYVLHNKMEDVIYAVQSAFGGCYAVADPYLIPKPPQPAPKIIPTKSSNINSPKQKDQKQTLNTEKRRRKWAQQDSIDFALAAMGIGIKTVTPKLLQQCLSSELPREAVSSHLQKLRMKVAEHYRLPHTGLLDNRHFVPDIPDKRYNMVKELWANPHFQGWSARDAREFFEKYQ